MTNPIMSNFPLIFGLVAMFIFVIWKEFNNKEHGFEEIKFFGGNIKIKRSKDNVK